MKPKWRLSTVLVAMTFALATSVVIASAAPQRGDQKTNGGMMARMAESDARITALAEQMNTSAGEAKIAAMAALLNAIVEQHKAMRSTMMGMGRGAAMPMRMEKPAAPAPASPAPPAAPSHDHSAN